MKTVTKNSKILIALTLVFLGIVITFIFFFVPNKPQYHKIIEWDTAGNVIKEEPVDKINFNESCMPIDLLKSTSKYKSRIIIYCSLITPDLETNVINPVTSLPFSGIVTTFKKVTIMELPESKLSLFLFDDESQNADSVINQFQVPLKWHLNGENTYSDEIIINNKKMTIVWGMEPKTGYEITRKDYISERNGLSDLLTNLIL